MAVSRKDLNTYQISIKIDPVCHDTWKFNFFLDLHFDDSSHLSASADHLILNQVSRHQSFGIDSILQKNEAKILSP